MKSETVTRYLVCLSFILLSFVIEAQDCLSLAFAEDSEDIYEGDEIWIGTKAIRFIGDTLDVVEYQSFTYYDFLRVKAHFRCAYEFSLLQEFDFFYVDEFLTNRPSNASVSIVYSPSQNLRYVVYLDKVYTVTLCDERVCIDSLFYNPQVTHQSTIYNMRIDSVEVHRDSLFETVTENVLLKESFVEKIPQEAVFSLEKKSIVIHEVGICPDYPYTYETRMDSFVSKESSSYIQIDSAVFKTRKEEVLEKDYYKDIRWKYLDTMTQIDEVVQVPSFDVWLPHFTEVYNDKNPFKTIDIRKEEQPLKTVPFPRISYTGSCPDGYQLENTLCVQEIEVPALYSTREYQVLTKGSSSTSIYIPSTYTLYEMTIIANKEGIPDSCIIQQRDSVSYEKLVKPASVIDVERQAVYETRTYQKALLPKVQYDIHRTRIDSLSIYEVTEPNRIAVEDVLCYAKIDDLLLHKIVQELDKRGVDIKDTTYLSSQFWHTIIGYQSRHNLPIGRITPAFLNHLSIAY